MKLKSYSQAQLDWLEIKCPSVAKLLESGAIGEIEAMEQAECLTGNTGFFAPVETELPAPQKRIDHGKRFSRAMFSRLSK